ncbi:MAG: poly(ADP-ribose) glycohydrolase domain-containing protein [Cyanobacteria bacterium J06633_8]
MSKNRKQRAVTAKETIDILERGLYQNQQEETIDIQEKLQAAIQNSIHYSEEDFSSLFSQLRKKQIRVNQNLVKFEINNETTLNAASRLANQEGFAKVLCLNIHKAYRS